MEKKIPLGLMSMIALAAGADAVAAQDWSGLCVGLSANRNLGTSMFQPEHFPDKGYVVDSAAIKGAFLVTGGIRTKIILGAKIALQGATDEGHPTAPQSFIDDYGLTHLNDAKLSIGTSVGNALVYGFGGISSSSAMGDGNDYSGPTVIPPESKGLQR